VVDATHGDTLALATLRHLRTGEGRQMVLVVLLSEGEHAPERRKLYSPYGIAGVVTKCRESDLPARIEVLAGLDMYIDRPAAA